ncbi:MAG: hypothetical protein ACK517_04600, partial [bacterium]
PQTIEPRRDPKIQHPVAPSFTQNQQPSPPAGHHQAAPSPSIHSAAPNREAQLQKAPTKRDLTSCASRASIKALRNPRNDQHHRAAAVGKGVR